MAVDSQHEDYNELQDEWEKCRDAAEGQRAIHGAGRKYLPALSGQTNEEYDAYKMRATFYEATGRTIDGLTSMIFRKPPTLDGDLSPDFMEDCTLDGVSLFGFAQNLTREVMTVARAGILVDYPHIDYLETELTVAQSEAMNNRPYFRHYTAESIINWSKGRVNNKSVVTQVRLKECVDVPLDEFGDDDIDQIRVLELNEFGIYQQRVFRQNEKHEWVQFGEAIIPVMNGQPMSFIPFVFINTDSTSPEPQTPPLMGLVNINISHYRTTADLEHGAHFTGLPTAVITGHNKEKDEIFRIGSSTAWVFSNENANAKYLEFEGKGLDSLKELCAAKEEKMAALGAQMLTPSARRNEAADTAELRHMGENSILSAIAQTVSDGLNMALSIVAMWTNTQPVKISLNRDFLPTSMTPQMITALLQSWQSGGISGRTLFENLKRGEVIESTKTYEDEQADIQTEPPPMGV